MIGPNNAKVAHHAYVPLQEFDIACMLMTCTAPYAPLHTPQSERNSLHTSLGEAKRALAAARESHERHLLEHQAELKSCEAAAAEARTREVAELRDVAARWEGGRVWRWDGMLVSTWNAGAWCCSCWWAATRCTNTGHPYQPTGPTNQLLAAETLAATGSGRRWRRGCGSSWRRRWHGRGRRRRTCGR